MKFRYQKIAARESEAFPERKFILRPVIPNYKGNLWWNKWLEIDRLFSL
jgi:hypothetical protein